MPFPEDGYRGEDIKELARAYYEKNGDKLLDVPEAERQEALAQFGLSINLPKMKTDLERYKIHYDNWFYESSLHESGYVKETVDLLAERGWTYEKDGALAGSARPTSYGTTTWQAGEERGGHREAGPEG